MLSFWNYNYYPSYIEYNGVWVNTNNGPTDPFWTELWQADAPAQAWSNETLSLATYAGQIVYLGFKVTFDTEAPMRAASVTVPTAGVLNPDKLSNTQGTIEAIRK